MTNENRPALTPDQIARNLRGEPIVPMDEDDRKRWESSGHDLTRFYAETMLKASTTVGFNTRLVVNEERYGSTVARADAAEKHLSAVCRVNEVLHAGLSQGVNVDTIADAMLEGGKLGRELANSILEKHISPIGANEGVIVSGHVNFPLSMPEGFQVKPSSPHIIPKRDVSGDF